MDTMFSQGFGGSVSGFGWWEEYRLWAKLKGWPGCFFPRSTLTDQWRGRRIRKEKEGLTEPHYSIILRVLFVFAFVVRLSLCRYSSLLEHLPSATHPVAHHLLDKVFVC